MNNWFHITPEDAGVAISTRIRLARNLTGYPFPARMTLAQKKTAINAVKEALLSSNSYIAEHFTYIDPNDLSELQLTALVEAHLASPDFVAKTAGKGLILSKDKSASIMLNEEDHIRIQVISDSLLTAFDLADKIDLLLGENLQLAFDQKLGYLTQCPTNLGTAMRASVMLHLPALNEMGAMGRITSNITKLGIAVRGTYGEGTEIQGDLYQISNQITLGLSEEEAVENLSSITRQIIGEEKKARADMMKSLVMQDKIGRALGILKNAVILSSGEFTRLISLIRLGVSTGALKEISAEEINSLSQAVMPATMSIGSSLKDPQKRDVARAEIVRHALDKIVLQ